MIKLLQFPPHFGLPNASPFCLKLETYLRMAKISFEVKKMRDPRKAPKGKLPFINDNGRIISDTSLIIDYLKQTYGDALDKNLTALEKAQALCIQRLLEDHFYWILLYSRWIDPAFWPATKNEFLGKIHALPRYFISSILQKKVHHSICSHGVGRHSRDEIYHFGQEDLKALATILNDQLFFLGNEPTSIDACTYGFLANIIYPTIESPLKQYALTQKNLVAYCERMKEKFYS